MISLGAGRRHDVFDATLAAVLLAAGLVDWATGALGGVFPDLGGRICRS